ARAIGAPMLSMIGMVASVGLNIILDPILIFGFDINVVGAALGTAISNVAASLFFIVYFMKNSEVVSVNIKLSKPNKEMLS
ncbi:polysaccharide biosynthesis C-terminal domain-containing protein, partial [Staphylococcus aureus]|nr:polysaccharide biosynthesis C-terminal domain-containing protein [Staphylococcus aureus]